MWGKVAIKTAMDMSPTNSFWFRATGKCNIFLCRYMGMAEIVRALGTVATRHIYLIC